MSVEWPVEHSTALTEFLGRGMTRSQAAAALNGQFNTAYSRNAVIGRANRMEYVGPEKPFKEPKPKSSRAAGALIQSINRKRQHDRREVTKIVAGGNGGFQVIQSSERDVTPRLRCVEVDPLLLTFEQLQENSCRYPYGDGAPSDFRWCGHPKFIYERDGVPVKASYCGKHFDITRGHGTPSERAATKGIAA